MSVSTKHSSIPETLIKVTGALFLFLAIFEIVLFVVRFQSTNLSFIVLIAIGIGMFEKHSWSRTLGIILSVWMIVGSFIALFVSFFPQYGFMHFAVSINSRFVLPYILFYILFYAFTGYALLRRDVRMLFSKSNE